MDAGSINPLPKAKQEMEMAYIRMRKTTNIVGRVTLIIALAAALGACSSKKQGATFGLVGANGANGSSYGEGGPGGYQRGRYSGGPVTPGTQRDFTVNVGDKVYFKTDSINLTDSSTDTLRQQARWLNQYPNKTITIEGHSDERGTREYNLGLAAKRARVIKRFLTQQGVSQARMRTISYGKERPVAMCNDISCWSKNRRGVTVLNKHG